MLDHSPLRGFPPNHPPCCIKTTDEQNISSEGTLINPATIPNTENPDIRFANAAAKCMTIFSVVTAYQMYSALCARALMMMVHLRL